MKEKIFAGAAGSLALVLLVGVTSSINAGADTNGDATESKQTVIESDISYYADELAGEKTASGEPYNPSDLTAAHRELPLGTKVKVVNSENKKSVVVEINDRGPYAPGRALDVSKKAAKKLGMIKDGEIEAQITVMDKPQ